MQNPWLAIPLGDYEAHMSLPSINQAAMLADELELLLEQMSPASLAIIGCAGGNGLERIKPGQLERLVAVDVNPKYIEHTRDRYAMRLPNLELHCADVESESMQFEPVDLTFAALIFEYVDVPSALRSLKRTSRAGGTLAVLLQLSHPSQGEVSASRYASLRALEPAMKLISPQELCREAAAAGFQAARCKTIGLPSGKEFWLQTFRS
jgi:ubiquinone/menaquinone biosynthesis C-methylase UbiE